MKKNIQSEPELSRPLRVERISPHGVEEVIRASEHERKALAERFDLVEITKLEATLNVVPERAGQNFSVKGRLAADVVQSCVVTLEPLSAHVEQSIDVHFAAPELVEGSTVERDLDEDDLEPIENGIIDLGEVVAQHFGLALDPYPRKPGLPPLEVEFGSRPAEVKNPFAKLVLVKGKKDE